MGGGSMIISAGTEEIGDGGIFFLCPLNVKIPPGWVWTVDDWWGESGRDFSQFFIRTCSASSSAVHSILKDFLLPGCSVPPSTIVSVVLLYLAISLHPVELLPLYLQPPSD